MAVIHTVTQQNIDEWEAQGGKLYINDVLVTVGATISNGDVLKAVANAGRQFDVENTLGFNVQPCFLYKRYGQNSISVFTTTNGIEYFTTVNSAASIFTQIQLYTIEADNKPLVFEWGLEQAIAAVNSKIDVYINEVKTPESYPDNLKVKMYEGDNVKITPKQGYILQDNQGNYFLDENSNFDYFNVTPSEGLLTLGSIPYVEISFSTVEAVFNRLAVDSVMLETLQANNASMFINDLPISIGSTAIDGDKIRIKANAGYELVSSPSFHIYNDELGYMGEFTLDLIDVNNSEKIINLNNENYLNNLVVTTSQVDIVVGVNNLYKITKLDLKQINIDRFVNSGNDPQTVIDYGTNILGIINLPFDINPEYIQDPELIKLGTHETTVTAPKVVTDKLYLNLGDISVPMPENSLGFTNVTALIHLPYANSLTLNANEVMGYIINVEYVIDLYNGNSYVNIKSNKSDSIIASSNVDLGINIPYSSTLGDSNTVYNSNMSLGGDNHVKTPYIEIIQNMPILGEGFFTAPITSESKLNNEVGFIQVENINLNVAATSSEKDMILSALRSGVIIND